MNRHVKIWFIFFATLAPFAAILSIAVAASGITHPASTLIAIIGGGMYGIGAMSYLLRKYDPI